jgi:transposase-like protein
MAAPPPPSPFDRPRWTEQEARAVLSALEHSRQPVSVFATEHGLDPQRLYSWRRRLGKAEPTTFRELIVRPSAVVSPSPTSAAPFEIVLASGVVVRVPASFDAAALERLLEILAQAPAC